MLLIWDLYPLLWCVGSRIVVKTKCMKILMTIKREGLVIPLRISKSRFITAKFSLTLDFGIKQDLILYSLTRIKEVEYG